MTIDLVSWFNHFPLSPKVGSLFTVRATRRGAAAQYLRTAKLPMGWVPSPAIAQRTCRVMLAAAGLLWGQDCVCWIDNILITAHNPAELEEKLARFAVICDDLRVAYRIEDKGQVLQHYRVPPSEND